MTACRITTGRFTGEASCAACAPDCDCLICRHEHDCACFACAVDAATAAYIECALWAGLDWTTTTDNGGDDDNPVPLDSRYGPEDLSAEANAEARRVVESFARAQGGETQGAWAVAHAAGWTPDQFGHDLFLTRNGHGAGYWDRHGETWANRSTRWAGEALSDLARALGEANLWPDDDGVLHWE